MEPGPGCGLRPPGAPQLLEGLERRYLSSGKSYLLSAAQGDTALGSGGSQL